MADKASLTIGDRNFEYGLLSGTVGPEVIDVRKFYGQSGMFTYDPGFTSTASCQSQITYIDGEKGVLLHRGYPIDQLAEHSTFMEVAYLLLYGELPKKAELEKFTYTISRHTMLHEQLATFYRGFRRDAHPMAIMCGVVGALSAFYHDSTDITDPKQRMIASHRLIAKMPTIAAMAYKYTLGQPFMYPQNNLTYTGNFLRMTFGHRVYKNYDPRAKVMQKTAEEVLNELGISDPVLDTARELEQIALKDDYFIEKKLYPNVDFYSGVILSAIGFPTDMFTALFALARTVGWVAQWNEMISDPDQKIGRPPQPFAGPVQRDYVPVDQR